MSPLTIEQRLAALGGEDAALNPDEIFAGHRRRRRRQALAGSLAAAVLLGGGVWGATALGARPKTPQIATTPTSTASSPTTPAPSPTASTSTTVPFDANAPAVALKPTAPAKPVKAPTSSQYCSTQVHGWYERLVFNGAPRVSGYTTDRHDPSTSPLYGTNDAGELRWYPHGLSGKSQRIMGDEPGSDAENYGGRLVAISGQHVVYVAHVFEAETNQVHSEVMVWNPSLSKARRVLASTEPHTSSQVLESGGLIFFDSYPDTSESAGSIYVYDPSKDVTSVLVTGISGDWSVAAGRLVATDPQSSLHMVDVATRKEIPVPAPIASLGAADGVALADTYALISTRQSEQRADTWIYRFGADSAEYVGINDAQQGGPTGGGPFYGFSAGKRYATTGFDGGPAVIDVDRRIIGSEAPDGESALIMRGEMAYGDRAVDVSSLPELRSCR